MAGRKTVSARAAERSSKPVRERLAGDLDESYEKLLKVLNDALEAKKWVRIERACPKPGCGCRHIDRVEVQDTAAALKAAEFFANQGLGRPGEDQGRGGGDFVVERYVVEPEDRTDEPVTPNSPFGI